MYSTEIITDGNGLEFLHPNQVILFPEPWNAPAWSFLDFEYFPCLGLRPIDGRVEGDSPCVPAALASAAAALASAAAVQ